MKKTPQTTARLGLAWLCFSLLLGACQPGGQTESVLVEFHRSGGIAGEEIQLVVMESGAVSMTRDGEALAWQLSDAELQTLRQALEAVPFGQMAQSYKPDKPIPDGFSYQLTYQGEQLEIVEPAIPEALLPVLELLNQLVAQSTPEPPTS